MPAQSIFWGRAWEGAVEAPSHKSMSKFFVNRPIVAMVISILMVLLGVVALVQLPISLYPNIAPPEILIQATYVGADALTVEEAVATPIEAQVTGVDNMLYMYSTSTTSGGQMNLRVAFDVTTDPSTDQVLAQMRYSQAAAQLPQAVITQGVTVKQSAASPLVLFALYSPKGTHDPLFVSNYAYININDPMTRVQGIGQVQISGAGQYAMRMWVRPDTLAKLEITANDIISAIQAQNTANASGQIGANPAPPGQVFTYTVRAPGRLETPEAFGDIIVRARPDGSVVRVKDAARVDLGAQTYNVAGRLDGKPATVIAVYQLPGSNALATVKRAKALMEEMKARFPEDLDYVVSLDTTLAVTAGIKEIVKTLFEALALVIFVVFIFLQGFRATLIPLLAVPVSLVGTFAVFPLLGFSINTLSLFGLVLAIGLVVDDAIVVVEAVEHHIEQGLAPREATLKAMEEVSGPVVAIALILVAVFVPTAFVPGITGRMYQQFAVTIAVSVVISAFNALTLSPALASLLLRPRRPMRGPLGTFFGGFNRWFARATDGYVATSAVLVRKAVVTLLLLAVITGLAGLLGWRLPGGFVPEEDQGYMSINVQLPAAASLERTAAVCDQIDAILKTTDGVQHYTVVIGAATTNTASYFLTLASVGGARQEGPHRGRDHRGAEPEAGRDSRGAGVRGSPARHPRRGRLGRHHLHARGPGGQGHQVPHRPDPGLPRGRAQAPRTGLGQHDLHAGRAPDLRGREPGQGPQTDRQPERGVPDLAGLPRRVLRQRLQPLRAGVAGVRAGRGRVPDEGRLHRPVLRQELPGNAGAALGARDDEAELRPGSHDPLQRVPRGGDQRGAREGLQHAAGDARARGGLPADHAPRDGLRLRRNVLPGTGRRAGRAAVARLRAVAARRLPHPGRAVRELVACPWASSSARPSQCSGRSLRSGCAGSRWTSSPRSAWS